MKRLALLAMSFLLLCPAAFAGEGGQAPTTTGETGLFTLFSGQTLPQGQWSFGLYYNNWDRLVIPEGNRLVTGSSEDWDYDWNRLSASVAVGVTDNLEVALMVPYDDFDASDNNRFGRINGRFFSNRIDASGLGNARLGAKWRVHSSEDGANRLALNAFVELPTGDDDEGVAIDDTGFGAGVAYERGNWVYNLGYRDPGDPDFLPVPEEIVAGLGYMATVSERLDWITELVGTFYTGDEPQPDNAIDLATGGRLWFGDSDAWAFNFAFRTNVEHLSDTDEFCPIGGLLGLTYFPRLFREKAQAEEERRIAAEEEARRKAEEEKRLAEEKARRKAEEEEERRRAEEERRRREEEEARRTPPPPPPPPVIEEVCHFALNSARVDNRCKATLDEVALRMKDEGERVGLVIGYTDSSGSERSNLAISKRRAEAVKSYLVSRHGIDPGRITTEGRGEAEPAGDNSTAEGRKANRRAVIILRVP